MSVQLCDSIMSLKLSANYYLFDIKYSTINTYVYLKKKFSFNLPSFMFLIKNN